MKTLQSERIRMSPELHFSTPSLPEVKVPRKESTTISHSSQTKWQNNASKNISSLENQNFHQNDLRGKAKRETLASLTTQHLRNRREIKAISENKMGLTECANFTFIIKYEDEYRVWNNFSMMYESRMYRYNEYRVTDDGLQVCYAPDPFIQQKWQNFIVREKKMTVFTHCNVSVDGFYFENYTLLKNFTVFFHPTEQNFTRRDYGVIFGHFAICSAKLSLSCNDDLVKVKYDEQYNVFKNFSLFYNNTMYDYREYRLGNEGLEMCASDDPRVQALWRTRNSWEKFKDQYKCRGSVKKIHAWHYTVNKQFTLYLAPRSQYFTRNDYGVTDGKPFTCQEKFRSISTEYTEEKFIMFYHVTGYPPAGVASLCALALSIICLLLLLIVYCMLPELRTLPGLNLMSLSFAVLLLQTYIAVYVSLYGRVGQVIKIPCDRIEIAKRFIMYSILTNAVVNIFHLRKTFCGNTLVKSDENKWKTFLKYNVFSWGVPLIVTIVYIVLVKKDVLRFHLRLHTDIKCVMGNEFPLWLAHMEKYGLPGCLFLYIIATFSFTAYRIRQKLKASSSIAQKSNIVKKRNSFVLLLKLSTSTAISLSPLLFENMHFDYDIKMALFTVAYLSGVYIGIAFAFTRKNYRLLKKKYFPAKKKPCS